MVQIINLNIYKNLYNHTYLLSLIFGWTKVVIIDRSDCISFSDINNDIFKVLKNNAEDMKDKDELMLYLQQK